MLKYIKEKIVKYRTMKGWSEYQLAEHSGITQSTISSWYRKDVTPLSSFHHLIHIHLL